MAKALRAFPSSDAVAIFDEAPGGGDPLDINSLRNRPALNPSAWLSSIYFHSSFSYFEVFSDDVVAVSHASIGVASAPAGSTEFPPNSNFEVDGTTVDWDVKTHSLGYKPLVMVSLNDDVVTPGYPVQVPGTTNGSCRYVSPYVTTSKVFLREFRSKGAASLGATTLNYRVVVFAQTPAPSGDKLIDFNPATGVLKLAHGRFDSSKRYLQIVPGGSPLGFMRGRTMDAKNGAPRFMAPDGTYFDPVPNTVKTGVWASGGTFASDTLVYGDPMNYTGTFTGGGAVQVQAP